MIKKIALETGSHKLDLRRSLLIETTQVGTVYSTQKHNLLQCSIKHISNQSENCIKKKKHDAKSVNKNKKQNYGCEKEQSPLGSNYVSKAHTYDSIIVSTEFKFS